MTLYELLLVLHVIAAVIWLGAGFVLALLVFGAERSGDGAKEAGYHQDVAWLAPRLFIPSSLAVLVIGVLLVLEGSWGFDQLWIVLGLAGWLASFLIGILYFKPESERVDALVEQHGAAHPEIARRVRRMNAVDRFELTILFLVVADMVVKPTSSDGGVLIGGAVILALGAAYAANALRAPLPEPAT